jgi:hypothetical protein
MSNCTILRFSTGARNHSLAFRRPGNKVITEIDTVARSRTTSVRTPCPISIRVSSERRRWSGVQLKSKIQSPLDAAKNPLNQVKVRFPKSVHVEARMLNSMLNIRTCQGQILKIASKTAILGGISNKWTIIS